MALGFLVNAEKLACLFLNIYGSLTKNPKHLTFNALTFVCCYKSRWLIRLLSKTDLTIEQS